MSVQDLRRRRRAIAINHLEDHPVVPDTRATVAVKLFDAITCVGEVPSMNACPKPDADALERGLEHVLRSPKSAGRVEMIVRRPAVDAREELDSGELTVTDGLTGDNWRRRGSRQTSDGSAHPDMQINIMNARVAQLVATHRDRWALAGDQFYVDLDLSRENLPTGTRMKLGSAVVEVSAMPHLGCRKFVDRFGKAAAIFVNSRRGKTLCLRGINARVVEGGTVRRGDAIRKLD